MLLRQRLTEMEYLLLHSGCRGHLLRYELLWDGGSGEENHLCGLLNVDESNEGSERRSDPEHDKSDPPESKSASGSGHVRGKSDPQKPASEQAEQGNEEAKSALLKTQ